VPSAEDSVLIHRPASEVFAFVADGETATRWRPGVLDVKHVSGQGAGAIYRQGVRGPGGRRIAADYEVTAYEPDRLVAFKAIAGPVRPSGQYRFETVGDDTKVSFSLGVELSGWKKVVMGRAVQATMNAEMRTLRNLKKILESTGS
jgi:uncharacterized membrane protein